MSETVEEPQVDEDVPGVDEFGDTPDVDEPDEPDDDDADLGDDDDDEPEAQQPQAGPTDAELDKALRSIETRAKTYVRFVSETAAAMEQPLVPCAVCADAIPGFIFDPRVVPLPEVAEAAMRALLGIQQEPPFVNDPAAEQCPTCEGWGRTRTGSKVDGKRLITCRNCKGTGWIGEARDLTPAEIAALPNLADTYVEPDAETPPDVDPWGTPRGHPEFGVSPPYREPGWQERIAAYTAGEPAPILA